MAARSQAQRLYRAEHAVWKDRGRPGILAPQGLGASWSPPGLLVFGTDGKLHAAPSSTMTKAEHAAQQKRLRAETLTSIEDVMAKITASSWWGDLQTGLSRPASMPTPYVHHGRGTSAYYRLAHKLRFGSDEYLTCGPVIAHEVAHYVVHYLIGAVADDHGSEFAAVDLALVELLMGAEYAQELRAAFARARVRVAKLPALPPVTEGPLIGPAPVAAAVPSFSEPVSSFEQPSLFAA